MRYLVQICITKVSVLKTGWCCKLAEFENVQPTVHKVNNPPNDTLAPGGGQIVIEESYQTYFFYSGMIKLRPFCEKFPQLMYTLDVITAAFGAKIHPHRITEKAKT